MITHTTTKHAESDSPIELIQGARYHPELSNSTVAAEVKKLIAEAIRAKLLPSMRVSVTSTIRSVKVRIIEASFTYKSLEHTEAKELITRFMRAYQKQEAWTNGDYINANFSDHVEWCVEQ